MLAIAAATPAPRFRHPTIPAQAFSEVWGLTPCGHSFCIKCLDGERTRALAEHREFCCPVCRRVLSMTKGRMWAA